MGSPLNFHPPLRRRTFMKVSSEEELTSGRIPRLSADRKKTAAGSTFPAVSEKS
jgi:hypothetical protein